MNVTEHDTINKSPVRPDSGLTDDLAKKANGSTNGNSGSDDDPKSGKNRMENKPGYEKAIRVLKMIGLGFMEPVIRLIAGDDRNKQVKKIWQGFVVPILAFAAFLILWDLGADALKEKAENTMVEQAAESAVTEAERNGVTGPELEKVKEQAAAEKRELIESSDPEHEAKNLLPGPAVVWERTKILWQDHKDKQAKKQDFYDRIGPKIERQREMYPDRDIPMPSYPGTPSFVDKIVTSLWTVFAGFLLAAIVALPIGIYMGLSKLLRDAINPLVQIFKPVSPVVWLLIVTMVVNAILTTGETMLPKAFTISFISVALCALWPTLVNTSVGVSSVDPDYLNVAKVLRLGTFRKIFKVVLPASLPMIFTGLRITLSIAWMVLIAIELLAQNPGLGQFVWEEFQNGSTESNGNIIVAAFVIGIIGFALDKIMLSIQKLVTFQKGDLA